MAQAARLAGSRVVATEDRHRDSGQTPTVQSGRKRILKRPSNYTNPGTTPMPTVFIPTMLQELTGGLKQVEVPGKTVADLIDNLEAKFPGIKSRLTDGGTLRSNLAVAVDGEVGVMGLLEDVPEGAEVHFIPAISGGIEVDNSSGLSIRTIQEEFAEVLGRHFGDLWTLYSGYQVEVTVEKIVAHFLHESPELLIASPAGVVTSTFRRVEHLIEDIDSFWDLRREDIRRAISQSNRLGILIGDIDGQSRDYEDSILRLGIYFDVLYLVDPLSIAAQRAKSDPSVLTGDSYTLSIVRLLSGLLRVRSLLEKLLADKRDLAAAFIPIVGMSWGDNIFDRIFECATTHANCIVSTAFEEEIRGAADLVRHTRRLSMRGFEERIRTSSPLSACLDGFRTYEDYVIAHQLEFEAHGHEKLRSMIGPSADHGMLYADLQARLLSLESADVFANCLGIDVGARPENHAVNSCRVAATQNCRERLGLREEEVVVDALLGGALTWLLPESFRQLREFRNLETLEGVRELFRASRRALQRAKVADRQAVADEMIRSFYRGVQDAIDELDKVRRLGGKNERLALATFVGAVGLNVLTTTFNVPLEVSVPISVLVPTGTVLDMVRESRRTVESEETLRRKPAFIAINLAKRNEMDRTLPLLPDGRRPSDALR